MRRRMTALVLAAVLFLTMIPVFASASYDYLNEWIPGTTRVSGDELAGATVRFHPVEYNAETGKYTRYITSLCIRDNGFGLGQNAVQLYKIGDSSRFVLTQADDFSYYINFFGGADDYSISNKRFDISDNDSYYHEGNAVHVVKGNETAENKRWEIFRTERGTYYIRNKYSLLYWDLDNNSYNDSNKLVQRSKEKAQEWEMEIVAADDIPITAPVGGIRTRDLKINYDSYTFLYDGKKVTGSNWMSMLPDDVVITDLTIPGVHDAAAVHTTDMINSSAQTQQLSLYDLMRNGIRYYDIRLGPEGDRDDPFLIHGGIASCYYKGEKLAFTMALGWMQDFLKQNPGETLILQIKDDRGGDGFREKLMTFLNQWIFGGGPYGKNGRQKWFYIGDHVPTLKECRGKIVILSRIDKKSNADFTLEDGRQWALDVHDWEAWSNDKNDPLELTCSGDDYEVWTQDRHKVVGESKWTLVANSVFNRQTGAVAKRAAAKGRGKNAWVVSYTSCVSMAAPVKYPQDAAREQNVLLKEVLTKNQYVLAGQYLGVVCSDFSDQQLAYLVYKQNFIAGTSKVTIRGINIDGNEPYDPLVLDVSSDKTLQEALNPDNIRSYFTKDNGYRPYRGTNGTTLLYRVPMNQVESAEEYAEYAADLNALHGYDEPTLYVALEEPVYDGDNRQYLTINVEQPLCGTVVTGTGSGQSPVYQASFSSTSTHIHLATEDGRPMVYLYDEDQSGWFNGLLEPGKTYGCRVVLGTDFGYYFRNGSILSKLQCGDQIEPNYGVASTSEDGKRLINYGRVVTVRHQLQHVNEVPATCTADGMNEHLYCTGCGRYFSIGDKPTEVTKDSLKIAALGHVWGEWTAEGAPEGQEVSICANDKSHKQFRTLVPPHAHNLTHIAAKAATCEEAGNIEYWVCDLGQDPCGKIFSDAEGNFEISADMVIIPATGHLWGTPAYSWIQDDSQVTASRVCLHDFTHVETQTAGAVDSGTPATCTEPGVKNLTAVFDAPFETQTKSVPVPALGHEWDQGSVTIEADCTTPGTRTFTCLHDPSHTRTEEIPAKGHEPEVRFEFTTADCTQGGSQTTVTYCDVCGDELSRETETWDALDHNWDIPTYTWSGDNTTVTASHECDRCHIKEQETAQVTAVTDPAPTCETAGLVTWYSDPFANVYFLIQEKSGEVPAIGHNWGPWENFGEALHRRVCQNDTNHTETAAHQWGPGYVTEKATADQTGVLSYACTECGAVRTEPIPVMQITPPAAVNGLVRQDSAQALITAGAAVGGTMQYAVGTAEGPAGPYGTAIPTATEAGTYYVWYRVVGDANHLDYNAPKPIEAVIEAGGEQEEKIEVKPLDGVPAELEPLYDSVEEIRYAMMMKVSINGKPVRKGNTALYDVILSVSTDGGRTWQPATEENYPLEGVRVTLPYPEGTNGADYDFAVCHMFTVTSKRLGTVAGGIEVPAFTETESGLDMVLRGLSPVLVSWEEPGEKPTPAPTPRPIPKTGDRSRPGIWTVLILLGAAAVLAICLAERKRRKQG